MPACAPVSSPVRPKSPVGQRPARVKASACGMRRQSAIIRPERELGDRVVEHVGGVCHPHAARAAGGDVDGVVADAVARDDLERRQLLEDLRRDAGVAVGGDRPDARGLLGEQAGGVGASQ